MCRALRFRMEPFDSGPAFIAVAPALALGCLVVDVDAQKDSSHSLLRELEHLGVAFPTILVGESPHSAPVTATVLGCVQKPARADALIECLTKARQLLRPVKAVDVDLSAAARLKVLTKQERDVLTGIVAGMTNKAIAAGLRTDMREVELSRIALMRTLAVNSLSGLVRLALAGGIKVFRQ
jgi:FixJ family two-component response regulator